MSGARLHTLLPELTTRQPVMVVGAAVIDVIADAYALPWRGCDCGVVINSGRSSCSLVEPASLVWRGVW